MTYRIEVDGEEYTLHLKRNGVRSEYRLDGPIPASGAASVAEIMPGVFSILLDSRNFTIYVVSNEEALQVWTNGHKRIVSVADARDRSAKNKSSRSAGPMDVRAQMPGKVIKLLVSVGAEVEAGQGVIVVEAMKMQNEMKSPKTGRVAKIRAIEGATIRAGESLMVIE